MYTDYVEEDKNQETENYYENNDNNDNKEKIKKIAFLAISFCVLLIIVVLVASACSKNKNESNDPTNGSTTTIVLNMTNLTIEVGESYELMADVTNGASIRQVVWLSDDTDVASVNDEGLVSAHSEGETVIKAIYGSIHESCVVKVTDEKVTIENIKISQNDIKLKKDEGTLLQITITPEDAITEKLIYESDNVSIATVDDNGYVYGISEGTTTITVKTSDEKVSDTVTVTVVEEGTTVIEPTSLELFSSSNNIAIGSSMKITSKILPSNATDKKLVWVSSNSKVATVDQEGNVKGISAGECTILASTSNKISAMVDIVVLSNEIKVTGISIEDGSSIQMKAGGTKKINYIVTPSNATNKNVTFSSSNSNVLVVDSNGLMAAISTGSAVVTVKSSDSNVTAIMNVTVLPSVDDDEQNSENNDDENDNDDEIDNISNCTSYGMIEVENNSKSTGAVVSSNSFANASPFTSSNAYTTSVKAPGIKILSIDDCVTSMQYKIYYGTTKDNLTLVSYSSNVKVDNAIYFNKGNGYYKVVIEATSESKTLTKNYYAIVSIPPTVTLNLTSYNSNTKKAIFKLQVSANKYLKKAMYCKDIQGLQNGCNPLNMSNPYVYNVSNSKTIYTDLTFDNMKEGYKICVIAVDEADVMSSLVCTKVQE